MRVIGLDLSLTRSAACTIPGDWEPGDWGALRWASWPTKAPDLPDTAHVLDKEVARWERVFNIANEIVGYAADEMRASQLDGGDGQVRIFCEDYAYGIHSSAVTKLAELRGVLAVRLAGLGHMPIPLNITRARTFIFGPIRRQKKGAAKPPQGAVKKAIEEAFGQMKAPFTNDDERDAFIIANLGLTELNIPALSIANRAA